MTRDQHHGTGEPDSPDSNDRMPDGDLDRSDSTIGRTPPVDGTTMHTAVEALATALHGYVDTVIGVRTEFNAHDADEDPRVLALENRISALNGALYDEIHRLLGLHPDLTTLAWTNRWAQNDPDAARPQTDLDTFSLGFVVSPTTGPTASTLDAVLELLDAGGEALVAQLTGAGFEVLEWATTRGGPAPFDDLEDDDEDEDDE
ncbi:hypothetical protein GALL_344780 [mine drainage metagenome]|uniref:Uncharacterized protein n=1 Tax=mine drainage metagenome TaxID=410659 RepID=A0A1J5QJQ6_9ZZZZ